MLSNNISQKGETKKMRGNMVVVSKLSLLLTMMMMVTIVKSLSLINYGDALTKSILFFEGQRSGKLPTSQRMTWRKDSALHDGCDILVSKFSIFLFFCVNRVVFMEKGFDNGLSIV